MPIMAINMEAVMGKNDYFFTDEQLIDLWSSVKYHKMSSSNQKKLIKIIEKIMVSRGMDCVLETKS